MDNQSDVIHCDGLYITYYSKYPAKGREFVINVSIIAANVLLSILGSVANMAIMLSYYRNKRLRSEHTMLLCILATIDFTITAVLQPLFVVARFSVILGTFDHCKLWNMNCLSSLVCINISMLLLIFLYVERFIALRFSYRYKLIVTRSRIAIAVFGAWLLVLGIVFLEIFRDAPTPLYLLYAILTVLTVFVCLSLGLWTENLLRRHRKTIKRTQTASLSQAQIKARKKTKRLTRTAQLISTTLLACYIPCAIAATYEVLYDEKNLWYYEIVRPCVVTLLYINSALDPCVLLWRNHDMRKTAIHLFDNTCWVSSTAFH